MNRGLLILAMSAWMGGTAHAQLNTFEIVVSNPVSPAHPATTIEVWAAWDPAQYAFAAAFFDIIASSDEGGFSDPNGLLNGPGDLDGFITPEGDEVDGMKVSQIHWPGHIFADLANPILLWQVTWSTADFTPRTVDVQSITTDFDLYIDDSGYAKGFIDEFFEGSATIEVVPAPGSAAMLLFGAALASRRRR
jgi:hypothetical protein